MSVSTARILTEASLAYGVRCYIGFQPGSGGQLVPTFYKTPVSMVYPIFVLPGCKIASVFSIVKELGAQLRQVTSSSKTVLSIVPDPPSIEIPSTQPTILDFSLNHLTKLSNDRALIGLNFYTVPTEGIGIDFTDPDSAHVLICGTTGSGKTSVMQNIALSLAYKASPKEVEMYFIDLKHRGLYRMSNLPHVRSSTSDPGEAARVVKYVRKIVNDRKKSGVTSPTIYLFVDEIAEFADCGIDDVFEKHFPSIARLGRELGVHLVIAAQKPESTSLGGQFLQQFNIRITGRLKDSHQSSQILGRGDTGAHLLTGKGSMIFLRGGDDVIKFQAFLCRDLGMTIAQIVGKWKDCPADTLVIEDEKIEIIDDRPTKYNHKGDAEILRPIWEQWYDFSTRNVRRGGYTALAQALNTTDGGSGRTRVVEALRILLDELEKEET